MKISTVMLIFSIGFAICVNSTTQLAYAHHEKVTVRITHASYSVDCASRKSCHSPYFMTIQANRTVEWQNRDSVSHTIVNGRPSDFNSGSLFDSGLIKPHHTFLFTFKNAGKYDYFCDIHPWATGMIIVKN